MFGADFRISSVGKVRPCSSLGKTFSLKVEIYIRRVQENFDSRASLFPGEFTGSENLDVISDFPL